MQKNKIDYKNIFKLIEKGFLREAFKNKSAERKKAIESKLDEYKKDKNRDDNDYFNLLVSIAFYSGFKAQTVTSKKSIICSSSA